MKVVLLHDWLTGFRGGERVLEAFCELFPNAPIYTLIHKKGSTSPIIESKEIVTSFLDKIPNIHESYRNYLPIMPLAAEKLKIIHKADIVLSSSHCVIKGVRKPENARHISYIHSPMRYIYDQFSSYFDHAPVHKRMAAHFIRPYLQYWDKNSNQNVDGLIANSRFVQERIRLFYGLKSEVIHPFVDLKDFHGLPPQQKGDFYLMVTAFAPNKRVDLAIEAFNQNKKKLKIIGGGSKQEIENLRSRAAENIEFLGTATREEVIINLANAKALIFPGVEDFGIVPLEALAAGTPVIAYKAAGVLETMNEDTAILFERPTAESLNAAIEEFEAKNFDVKSLKERANTFSKDQFMNKIKLEVMRQFSKTK